MHYIFNEVIEWVFLESNYWLVGIPVYYSASSATFFHLPLLVQK